MNVKEINHNGYVSHEVLADKENKVIFRVNSNDSPSIMIGFVCEGKWFYQSLMWSCRGGKQKYFQAMVCLYRYLRRNDITGHSLRYLAWGENRLKHGGLSLRYNRKEKVNGHSIEQIRYWDGLNYEVLNHNCTGGAAQGWSVAEQQRPGFGNLVTGGPLDAPI